MKLDIHLVSWNRPKMTELVIRTIHRNTKSDNYRLVVWDNGSDDQTKEMLTNLVDNGFIDEMCWYPDNAGLEAARQFMLINSTYRDDYFVCVDNDCLPPPIDEDGLDWTERLLALMTNLDNYAAIAMRTQVMIGTGNIFEEADRTGLPIVNFPHPGGSYRIMNTEAVRSVNGWERKEPGRGSEERYICGKLHEVGYGTAFATDIQTLHLFGTRGDRGTDRWGYDRNLQPEDTGHSDIYHPALIQGDDYESVKQYVGEELAERYFQ